MQFIVDADYTPVHKSGEEWLCVEQNRELFTGIRGRGGANNVCFHSRMSLSHRQAVIDFGAVKIRQSKTDLK